MGERKQAKKSVVKALKTEGKRVVKVIKKVPLKDIPKINLTPISNWMVTTAYIETADNSLVFGTNYKPTFLNMQQVLAAGAGVDGIKIGDWVYIDMSRFIKTVKKKSTIRAGVGGEDMISESLVPPVFAAPGDDNTYFKINDREVEGVIKDPYSMKQEYQTLEDFIKQQELMEAETALAKSNYDKEKAANATFTERAAPSVKSATTGFQL